MPVALVDGTPFRHGLTQAELRKARADLEVARARRLLASVRERDAEGQRLAVEDLLHRPEPKICSAVTANKKIPSKRRRTLEWCMSIDKSLDVEQPIDEPVRVWGEPKKEGGMRAICEFGPKGRTAQDMVQRVMAAYYKPRSFQFTHQGVQRAIAAVRTIVDRGFVYAAKLDIRDCFGSFDSEKLSAELPIPMGTVEYVVTGRHLKVELDPGHANRHSYAYASPHTQAHLIELARRGLPPGSACAPIVAAYCISRLAWTPSGIAKLSNYADDFFLLASSAKHLSEEIGTLTDAVEEVPGGHFQLRVLHEGHFAEGVDFLGHHLKIVGGSLQVSVTERNLHDFLGHLLEVETSLGPVAYVVGQRDRRRAIELLARFYAFADGWSRNFRECDDIGKWTAMWQSDFHDHLSALGISEQEVKVAIDDSMTYEPSGYALDG
jgi:hypothetical protein